MRPRFLVVSLATTALLGAAAPALAQQGGNIDLQAFRPAIDSRGYITANASQVLGHKELSFGLVTNWGYRVLEFQNGDTTYTVENIITPNLQFAYGVRLGLEVEFGVTLPFQIISGDVDPDYTGVAGNPNDDDAFGFESQGIGDIGLHAKIRFLNTSKHPFGFAVMGSVYIPGGYDENSWMGEGQVVIQPWAIIDKELSGGKIKLAANAGLRLRTGDHDFMDSGDPMEMRPGTSQRIEAGTEIPWALAASYAVVKQKFDIVAEVFGAVPMAGENYMPLEAVAGIKLYLAKNSFFLLGGGVGLVPGEAGGNPDARAFIGIVFEPNIGDRDGDGIKDDVDRCPDDPEDFDDFEDRDGCPEPDNDRDGILDDDDACPNEPEDKDNVEDEDGCPEKDDLDRDGDGILDDDDACPDDPEDFDKFEDEDGCPELDNDKDGILDVDDLCPNDPEDFDEWEDKDGCPDPDNDKDRILDVDDKCPNEPETYNGKDDEDGCPDRGLVVRTDTSLEILDKIYFETNKAIIKGESSFQVLDAVAATMIGNPDILLLEIQGHTDIRNTEDYNLKLSQDRAEAVRAYLIEKGVEAERLKARGYGEGKPIEPCGPESATKKCADAWSKNRRVEFIILKRSSSP